MSSCMYTAQGDFVCQENKDTTDTIENFAPLPDGPYLKVGQPMGDCKNCSNNGNTISCDCLNVFNGRYRKASVYRCNKPIYNYGGSMVCG